MVQRFNKKTHGAFLGCSAWPECQETREIPEYVRLIAQGATQLPGLEDL
jgi:ssDNA-binding Zn-finger/Zn-ribbon topoisomerase 1